MSKQAVVYTYNNAFYGNGVDIKNEFLKETLLSLATSLIPYIGDGTDLFSSIYGRDIFTDESLSAFERGLGFLCLGELRRVDDVIDAAKIAKKLPNGVKYLDVAASLTTRYGDELVTLLSKCDSKTVDLVLEMSQKHGDSFVKIFLKYSDEGVELLTSKHGREAIDVITRLGDDGVKALKFNDELLSKYSKLDDIEKFAAETASLAKELNCKGFTTSNYLKVMKKSFGWKTSKKLGDTLQAHHIFPSKFFGENGEYADLLKNAGINYCDPRLISWYDKSTHLSNVAKYNSDILQVITDADNDIVKLIDGIREVARKYGFEPKF